MGAVQPLTQPVRYTLRGNLITTWAERLTESGRKASYHRRRAENSQALEYHQAMITAGRWLRYLEGEVMDTSGQAPARFNSSVLGYYIKVGTLAKFVGKVFTAAPNVRFKEIAGRRILFREVGWLDVVHHHTNSLSVDSQVWLEAQIDGATAMVIYCKERRQVYILDEDTINSAPDFDAGERDQKRIPLSFATCYEQVGSLTTPRSHTDRTVE